MGIGHAEMLVIVIAHFAASLARSCDPEGASGDDRIGKEARPEDDYAALGVEKDKAS